MLRSGYALRAYVNERSLNERVNLRLMASRAFLDFLDWRRNDWGLIFRVMKFQMHAPAYETQFEH